MVNFILGGAGYGKSTLMNKKISEFAETEKKVIVIVPEQFSFNSDKKLYKLLGAEKFNKILSLSFTSLAKDIFEKFGGSSGEYADDIQKYIIMNKTLYELTKSKSLSYFSKNAEKPDFSAEAIKLVTDFRQCGAAPDEVMKKLSDSSGTLNEKISDIALIYYTYDRMLKENGLKDQLTDISESAAISSASNYFKNTIVFFDEFESFTLDEYDMIDAIISDSNEVFISLRLEHEGNCKYTVFDSVNNTWKKFTQIANKYNIETNCIHLKKPLKYKSEDLAHLNMNIMRPERKVFGKSENIKLIECRDIYEEADYICSEINRLIKTENFNLNDIVIISRQLNEYVYVFEAALKKYDIPYSMNVKKSVMHTSIIQLIVSILDIIIDDSPSSENIFKYVKTQLNNFSQEEIARLENYCYEWNISGEDWFKPFNFKSESCPNAEKLRKKIIEPIVKLKEKCQTDKSSEICIAIYDFLEETKVPVKICDVCRSFEEMGLTYLSKEMKRIWNIFSDTLDTVAEIGGETNIKNFREIFLMLLRQITYSLPPQTLDSVNIYCADTARPDSPKVAFVCGVNEGYFPSAIKMNGLLNEKDHIFLKSIGFQLSRDTDELISDEKLIVYKTLTHASEKIYISYPLSSLMGTSLFPASIISQIRDIYTNDITEYASQKSIIFYSSTLQAAYYNYVRHFSDRTAETESLKAILEKDEFYRTKIEYLEEVSHEKSIVISNKDLMRKLFSDKLKISATGFENYNICHFKFFCQHGLKIFPPRKREINFMERGNIVHKCLEGILKSCSSKEEFDSLSPKQIALLTREYINKHFNENLGGEAAKTARIEYLLNSIGNSVESLILHLQKELAQSEFRPVDFELSLSSESDGLSILKTEDGIEIALKGVIDRIDVFENDGKKYLRIIDYKTGEKKISMADIYYGINMQMLIYLFSITGENAKYSGYIPSGVLYMPSGDVPCSRERNQNDTIEKVLNSHYKMNGLILNDRTVLDAMEKNIAGIYIPASLLKNDEGVGAPLLTKSSSVLSSSKFKALKNHTQELMIQMCRELYSGNIDADPIDYTSGDPCKYCDYWSVCGVSDTKKHRKAEENASEIIMEKLSKEEDNNEPMD